MLLQAVRPGDARGMPVDVEASKNSRLQHPIQTHAPAGGRVVAALYPSELRRGLAALSDRTACHPRHCELAITRNKNVSGYLWRVQRGGCTGRVPICACHIQKCTPPPLSAYHRFSVGPTSAQFFSALEGQACLASRAFSKIKQPRPVFVLARSSVLSHFRSD